MTNLYNKYILPGVTNFFCGSRPLMKQRAKVVPYASGRVLEVGAGTGLNFSFYDAAKVEQLFALEPSKEMWSFARKKLRDSRYPVEFIKGFAEAIPMEDQSVDTVVITYTMCSIPDIQASFSELRRVLKTGGQLLFCEHGVAPEKPVQRFQNFINPVWKRLGGGCNLNRNIPQLIHNGAFRIERLDTMYIPGPKFASYNYWGMARPL